MQRKDGERKPRGKLPQEGKTLRGLGGSERKRKEMSSRALPLSLEPTCSTRTTEYDFELVQVTWFSAEHHATLMFDLIL